MDVELPPVALEETLAQKKALRKQVITRRDALDPRVRERKSDDICVQLVACLKERFSTRAQEADAPCVALFSALGSEVDLRGVVRAAAEEGWQIALPVMFQQTEEPGFAMVFVNVSHETALLREETFMAKPAKNLERDQFDFARFPELAPEKLDAMIVPLVAFDMQGGRLGYGGGNYDRYLPQLRADCWITAVAFDEQRVSQVPRASFDRAVPGVIHA